MKPTAAAPAATVNDGLENILTFDKRVAYDHTIFVHVSLVP